jgi:hypothetical protein
VNIRERFAARAAVLAAALLAACNATTSGPGDDGGGGGNGLEVSPPRVTLAPGGETSFAARMDGAAIPTVSWSVREGGGGAIDQDGRYTAPGSAGTFTIVATEPTSQRTGEARVTVLSGGGFATHGMMIPVGHPRLWFDADRLARARTWIASNPFTPPSSEDTAGGWADTALHGLLTNDASGSCGRAIDWAVANAGGQLGDTGGVACDRCRWNGEQLILVYDWCHDWWTPAERTSFISAVNAGLYAWANNDWGGPSMYGNNYYWGYLRNELEWAITSYGENTATAPGTTQTYPEWFLDHVLQARLAANFNPSTLVGGDSRGGVPHEQFGYGATTGSYALVPFTSVGIHGRDLFAETDVWRELVYAYLYATTPARSVVPGAGTGYTLFPANDDEAFHTRLYAHHHYFTDYMTAAATRWGDAAVGRHARQWMSMVGTTATSPFRHVQAVDVPNAPLSFSNLPLDYFASGAGYLFTRSRWGEAATSVLIQGADFDDSTLGHQHGDYGTFQIWRGASEGGGVVGRYLSRETVTYAQNVTGYAGSGSAAGEGNIAHNSVLVDGQNIGPQYSGGTGRVERVESQPAYSFLAVNLVPPATRAQVWRREFVFARALETLVILDRLQTASASATKTFLNHCETAPVVSGDRATCTVGGSALVMTTLLPGEAQTSYRVVDEGSSVYHQYRVEVDTTPGTAQSYILTVLQAKDQAAASLAPSVTEDATSITLRLDASTSITFRKGMTSTGGSFTLDGSTTPFRESAQRMSVSDAGPAWEP